MKTRILWILLAGSVLLNLFLFLRHLDISSGGGRHKQSPNGAWIAMANSRSNSNPLASDRRISGQLTIRRESLCNPPLVSITVCPENVRDEMEYRNLDDLIKWSDDSSNVVFRTPSGEFKVAVPQAK